MISTNEGRIVASKHPSRMRQIKSPVKFFAAATSSLIRMAALALPHPIRVVESLDSPVQIVTMLQEIMLNMTQYLTGKTTRTYADSGCTTSCAAYPHLWWLSAI